MSVSTVNSTSGTSGSYDTTSLTRVPKQTLDAGDFMKLLSVQMQNQDPMSPMDNNQQMEQVAQMSSMQSTVQMAQSIAQMAQGFAQMSAGQSLVIANSYLGQQVVVNDGSGQLISGKVTAIDGSGTTPQLLIGSAYYPLTAVSRVELPSSDPSAPTT